MPFVKSEASDQSAHAQSYQGLICATLYSTVFQKSGDFDWTGCTDRSGHFLSAHILKCDKSPFLKICLSYFLRNTIFV